MRRIYLNDGWSFYPSWSDTCIRTTVAAEGEKVRIPHTTAVLPYNYPGKADGHNSKLCGYVYMLAVPESFLGKELWLTFDGIAYSAQVFINGKSAAVHAGGYTAFSVNIAPYIHFGCENRIAVKVDCKKAPQEGSSGELSCGGIYRDVYIEVKKPAHIEDIFVRTKNSKKRITPYGMREQTTKTAFLSGAAQLALSVRFSRKTFDDRSLVDDGGYIQVSVFDTWDNCLCVKKQKLSRFFSDNVNTFETNKSRTATIRLNFEHVSYWDVDQPQLYFAEVLLRDCKGEIQDSFRVRFGFRDIQFKADGFYLNGQKLKIMGLNRHQSYPCVGYGVPESMQRMDAELLKNELGVNAVRTAGYTPSVHFINRCDELGLLVFMEPSGIKKSPGTSHSGIMMNPVREMIAQYRNHPSIICWELLPKADGENEDVYIKTGQMARRMDPSRVFDSQVRAGLVDENAGSGYVSKMFDNEEHRVKHALHHGHILEAMFENPDNAGSFGWCMFDYQTRPSFGSGDGICYQGVMDMYRNMKPAGWLYASQGRECVCRITSDLAIGDYGPSRPESLWIFTNCDYVRVFREDGFLGEFFPDRKHFGHLPHPPVEIPARFLYSDVSQGENVTGCFRFEFIKNGHLMQRILRHPAARIYLDVLCSHSVLVEKNSYDMALIRIRAVDAQGLWLPYYNESIRLKASGPIELVGPDTISLKGGCGGIFVRTLGGEGNAKVTLFAHGLEPVEIYLKVIRADGKKSTDIASEIYWNDVCEEVHDEQMKTMKGRRDYLG